MRTKTVVLVFAVLLVATVFAGDNDKGHGCKLQGTWSGEFLYPLAGGPDYYWFKYFVTYHGTGDNEGTEVMDWINPVPAPGHKWSNGRGVWKKIGPNKYSWTAYVYEFDEQTGDIIYILRHGGIKHLTDCNTMEATDIIEYLAPDGTPLMCVDGGIATVHRMLVQEPCEPPPPLE
jgi:hypothetical protein